MELFKGKITLELFSVVESQESKQATKSLAHEGLSSEFLDELWALTEAKGYYVQSVAADLNKAGEATPQQVKTINEAIDSAKFKDDEIRGNSKVTRTQI
ncbi:hypothetical protein [Solibacillus daqui]|uniref:hypothetical protein n=1 Tax=Solibacillus daqui TaxID=2912187 RepID=UPI002366BEDE|nr:hypothetical protein [Solibacillus daqui]